MKVTIHKIVIWFIFLSLSFQLNLCIARADDSFRFVTISDSENYKSGFNSELNTVLDKAKDQNPNFAVFTGDILATGGKDLTVYRSWVSTAKKIMEEHFDKSYIVFGKHDVECGLSCVNLWTKAFWGKSFTAQSKIKLYHSFDYQNTHFVLMSSDYPLKHNIDNIQLDWLEKDLAAADKPNRIVITHVPPIIFFPQSAKECHDMSCHETQRRRFIQILKKYKVDLVISGHEHVFSNKISEGIDYILSGNTGNGSRYGVKKEDIFCLVSVEGEKIILKAIKSNGSVKKEIRIK